jgi:hypothetical protein
MHFKSCIFFCFEVNILVSWSRKIVFMSCPPRRVWLFAAKANELVDIKSGIVFGAKSICTGESEDYPAIMTNIMLDTLGYVG